MTTICVCIAEHFLRDVTYDRIQRPLTSPTSAVPLFSEYPLPPSIMSTSPSYSASSPAEAEPYNITHLDALLATYLSYLESYSTLRSSLNSNLQSGFFSLAQAQRSALLPPGQRYGTDMYDERLKAGRRVQIRKDGALAYQPETAVESKEPAEKPQHQEDVDTPKPTSKPTPPKPSRDPLRQFGILTPAPLRACQASFISASTVILELINTSREMGELERKIEEMREALGMHDIDGEDVVAEVDKDANAEVGEEKDEKTQPTTSPRPGSLASRSKVAEPRSRVLKLGT
jgi:coiled-coil domain-containing protein 115